MPLGDKTLELVWLLKGIKDEKLCLSCGMAFIECYVSETFGYQWFLSFLVSQGEREACVHTYESLFGVQSRNDWRRLQSISRDCRCDFLPTSESPTEDDSDEDIRMTTPNKRRRQC